MARREVDWDLRCVCPCHDATERIAHVVPCCCPHRFVLPRACPECPSDEAA